MLKRFLPKDYKKSVFEITPEYLKERNLKGVITDLDNTLVSWDEPHATPEILEWYKILKENGISVVIVSNNIEKRVGGFAKPYNIPFVYDAQKPRGKAFKKALQLMNLKKDEVIVVGDQLLTDIWGGNRNGFHTMLVVPVSETDAIWTKLNRIIERKILQMFKRKGMLEWEELPNGGK